MSNSQCSHQLVFLPFPTEKKKWFPPTGFKTFIQLQWLHALLVKCLVRHFQIFRGGFLVNNNKWSSWPQEGVYLDSVRSANTSTALGTFTYKHLSVTFRVKSHCKKKKWYDQ